MPKVNSFNANSLKNLCLISVSDNIDKWWQKYHKSCQDTETLSDRLAIVSPFDCLSMYTAFFLYVVCYFQYLISHSFHAASELLEKVMEQLGFTECKYLELFIVPQLLCLTVRLKYHEYLKYENPTGLFHLASTRCKILKVNPQTIM